MLPAPHRCNLRSVGTNGAKAVPLHPVKAKCGSLPSQPHNHPQQQQQQQQLGDLSQESCAAHSYPATRRTLLAAAVASWASAPWLLTAAHAASGDQSLLYVSADGSGVPAGSKEFPSISEALDAARPGTRILIGPGRYVEKLTITKPVALKAYPEGADVEVVWETQSPYQHTVECSFPGDPSRGAAGGDAAYDGREVLLLGLRIRHYSKSVANNYGVYINAGSPVLDSCDISSSSGTGLGLEGACRPLLTACRIHSCASHGVAIFGAIAADELDSAASCPGTEPRLRGCVVEGNKLDGVLLRSGASVNMEGCSVRGNGGFGVNLQDAGGSFRSNTMERNGRGAARVVPSFDLDLDLDSLRSMNKLLGDLLVK